MTRQAKRMGLVTAVLLLAAVLLAGCGQELDPGITGDMSPTKVRTVTGRLGQTLRLVDPEGWSRLEVTALRTMRLPAYSMEGFEIHPDLFGVEVRIRNVDSESFSDVMWDNAWVDPVYGYPIPLISLDPELSRVSGEVLKQTTLEDYDLAPGQSTRGWLWFDIGRDVMLKDFVYRPSAEMGYVQGEWKLGAAGR